MDFVLSQEAALATAQATGKTIEKLNFAPLPPDTERTSAASKLLESRFTSRSIYHYFGRIFTQRQTNKILNRYLKAR